LSASRAESTVIKELGILYLDESNTSIYNNGVLSIEREERKRGEEERRDL